MTPIWNWVASIAAAIVILPIVGWIAAKAGRSAAKRNPGVAGAIMMLMTFAVFEPPPPPKAERVLKNEEGAGDPPEV